MTFSTWNRKAHYWVAIVSALPVLVILVTGVLLQLKKQNAWVQPTEQRGTEGVLAVSFEQILANARAVAPTRVQGWEDVNRIDVRPKRGLIKVTTKDNWEIQMDAGTGEVLQVAYRRSDWIESLHDGSWFHEGAKYFVFLPSALALLFLWLKGIYFFVLPIFVRSRKRRALARKEAASRVAGGEG